MKVGTRVSFDCFGKRVAGHITAIHGIEAEVLDGLSETTYLVNMNDLVLNPLHEDQP